MKKQAESVEPTLNPSKQPKLPKKGKLVVKFTDSDGDDDNATLSFKFKNLKSDESALPIINGEDIGQEPSKALNY